MLQSKEGDMMKFFTELLQRVFRKLAALLLGI